MTQAIEVAPRPARASDVRIIGAVSAAHFTSHYYMLVLPPLFDFVRGDYGVNYTELGLALAVFNIVSATLQTPAGFLVDRMSPRSILVGGLALGSAAFALAGLIHSFWFFVAAYAIAGLGNTVYHPAGYAILSRRITRARLGRAFSIYTFAGLLGSAVAPATILLIHGAVGWRGAYVAAGALGSLVAILLLAQGRVALDPFSSPAEPRSAEADTTRSVGWRLLLSSPIVRNLVLFVMLSVSNAGLQNYSVVALASAFATPVAIANTALSALLFMSAFGVLIGGAIAARIDRHDLVASGGLAVTAVAAALVGLVDFGPMMLVVVMGVAGLLMGVIMPSRDMIVRAVTPEGSFGKVFGFVSTGFNIGGIFSPLLFGWLMDAGHPQAIFLLVAGLSLMSIPTVMASGSRRGPTG